MISTATRFFCGALSALGAAGLVAFSAPTVTIAAPMHPHAVQIAADAPVATLRRG